MKNWIVALAILIIPVVAYFVLDKTNSSKAAFEAQAQSSYSKPVVMKFSSPMCLDCKKLEGVTSVVMPQYADKVDYQKYTTQTNDSATDALIKKYNITLVPTMIFLKKDGNVYKKTEGYMTEKELESILKGLING